MDGLLVVGMHRSGTSAVARVVHALGRATGGTVMAPRAENARGFFERDDVAALDNRWLNRLGGSWEAPPRTTAADWESLDPGPLRADRNALDVLDPDHPAWFVKDPRISLLVPLWDRLALQRLPVVLAVRDPLESAGSVWLRDGITPRRALGLWYVYVHSAASALADRPGLVIDYGRLVSRPAEAVHAIDTFARPSDRPPKLPSDADLIALVEPDLRRQDGRDLPRLPREYVEGARDLHAIVASAHAQPATGLTVPKVPDWVDEVWDELRELHRLRRTVEALSAERDRCADDGVRRGG